MIDPDGPTLAQIVEMFGRSYTPEGVVVVLWDARDQVTTAEGRQALYERASALAEGIFT